MHVPVNADRVASGINPVESIARKKSMIGFASAVRLESNSDNLHFSAKALREFGIRYYDVFKKLEDKNKIFTEKALLTKQSGTILSICDLFQSFLCLRRKMGEFSHNARADWAGYVKCCFGYTKKQDLHSTSKNKHIISCIVFL